jgi:hypothetical protein
MLAGKQTLACEEGGRVANSVSYDMTLSTAVNLNYTCIVHKFISYFAKNTLTPH